ncbi:MAG TPA: polymer-forming cytoskeletal protein [Bdellovibrionota bacterium]|jgi:cytoskeletal protein CcmA (bactofilin family)|nr:polymer-forming cytoskeletal protein [Bdellovibrionota bacterium]
MATRKDLSVPVANYAVTGVIDQGCEFEGKLCFQGTVRINGSFKGEIFTPDTLIIGEDARVQGQIDAGVVVICGDVRGDVKAKYRVEIHRPAVFRGDILTPSLSVDEGVIFEGSSKMAHGTSPA